MKLAWFIPVLCALLTACSIFASPIPSLDELRVGEVRESQLVEHVTRHSKTGVVLRTWSEWSAPSGRGDKHGPERTWYQSGAREWEREFDHGTPIGHWRGWYEDGTPMAESFHSTDSATVMSFWHSNGQLSAQGPALNGARSGSWSHWYANGQVREAGEYVDGRRSGEWSLFHEDGSLEGRGRFEAGRRVGTWADASQQK